MARGPGSLPEPFQALGEGGTETIRLICPTCVVFSGLMQPHLGGTGRVWRCPRAASRPRAPRSPIAKAILIIEAHKGRG